MTANKEPIYTLTPVLSWAAAIATANTAKDGTGTVATVYTAGANGSFVQKLIARPTGTNTASVLRVFANNGSTNATAGNNSFIADISLPAITNSEVAAQQVVELFLNIGLPAGYKINCTIGTTVAAGWAVSAVGGDF